MNIHYLKTSEKKVLSSILENPDDTAAQIAEKLELGKRTVERALARLQELGMIERIGKILDLKKVASAFHKNRLDDLI